MLSQPRTDQVLDAIAADLRNTIAPALGEGAAAVTLEQIAQLVERLARRAAHEIGWMHEETAAIDEALDGDTEPTTAAALDELRSAPADSLHLADVARRYHLASAALSRAIEAAFAAADTERVAALKSLLGQRIANEQEVLGQLDLVGRG